ncbi:MFS transporter [Halalkalibacter urbisdiaboli]|uniref:MFS transporter n=1 Tax=Halalkalibacter urbisdiaboli TaxID=1960589 RepID=UPI000B454A7F|nr:MFS transporter [Halalkalibacter urbisdiaboli]
MFRISVFYFVLYSSFAVILMFMPLYLQYNGLGKDEIGWIMAMGSVISVVGQPIWGYISDKLNSTKTVLFIVMVCTFAFSFLLFSVKTFLTLLFVFTLFMFFMTSCGPLTDSIAMYYARTYKKNYGFMRSFGSFGVGISALILGIVISIYGIEYLGWMYAIMMSLSIPLIFLVREAEREESASISRSTITFSSIKVLFQNKVYLWIVGISFLILTPHKMNDSLFTIYLSELGASEQQMGVAWMLATFSSIPVFIATGILLKHYHELVLMVAAAFVFTLRWFLYGYMDQPKVLIYLQLLQGVTFPIFFVSVFQYVTKLIPKDLIATGQLLFIAAAIGLGGLVGNAGGGWLMESFSPQLTYQLAGVLSTVGSLLIVVTIIRGKQKNKKQVKNVCKDG